MSIKTMTEYEQHARETLPEGFVFLGRGGGFKTDGEFTGIARLSYTDRDWDDEPAVWAGDYESQFYAAKHDSDVVCINQEADLEKVSEYVRAKANNEATPELFPKDAKKRKEYPVGTLITDYFPHAIAALAHHSYVSQQQHGEPSNGKIMEWLKDKSIGDGNQTMRHYMEGHKLAALWRMAEEVQRDIEAVGSTEAYLEREGY